MWQLSLGNDSGIVQRKVFLLFSIFMATTFTVTSDEVQRPHIIFILADDLGWNDVSFHGSSQIPTPNIDALAYSGIILNQYYVTPICTPSRSALMTGKYPIHTGMQHRVLYAAEPRGLPLNETILPQYLKELGYVNHCIGKWHLGHYKREYTPTYRGFDSHVGYWTGHQDYFDHTAFEDSLWGLDMRRGMDVAYDLHGQYTTNVIAKESVRVIREHNVSKPLFLYMAHAAVHSGNPYSPLPAPDDTVANFTRINNFNRRKFAGMLTHLDSSVGEVVKALQHKHMLNNSIIIFSTDNGGPAEGFNLNAASNWPLRGVKNTLWEGGVRGTGLIWSPLLQSKQRVSNQTLHITDWLPTLYHAAGGNVSKIQTAIDGIDLWDELSENKTSKRVEILHNIDDIWGSSAVTKNQWKLIKGTNYKGYYDHWYGPAGNRGMRAYNTRLVMDSNAGQTLRELHLLPNENIIRQLRKRADVNCTVSPTYNVTNLPLCRPLENPCLFNVIEDPCEQYNVAAQFPNILSDLLLTLDRYNKTAVPPANLPLDPRADPKYYGNIWTNFGDYNQENQT